MLYKYVAYTADKTVVQGTIEAGNEDLAKEAISASGYKVLSLKAKKESLSGRESPSFFSRVSTHDVIVFSRLLATLVERGTPPLAALELLRDHTRKTVFRKVLDEMIQDIQQGGSLSEAVAKHPKVFPYVYARTIKASEQAGELEKMLRQVAAYLEREQSILKKVRNAMIYPAFLVTLAVVVAIILFTTVLPPIVDMFDEFDEELPITTKILSAAVSFVADYKLYLLIVGVAAIVLVVLCFRSASGRRRLDRLMLRLPLFGQVNKMREMAHLSRMMSMLFGAGLPAPEILEAASQTARNSIVREAVEDMRRNVISGRPLSQSMGVNEIFPSLMVQMVRVGEEAGTLDQDLMAVAEMYEQETEDRVNNIISLMGPVLIVVIGAGVAFLAVSVVLPMYQIMGSIE